MPIGTRTASSAPASVVGQGAKPASDSKDFVRSRQRAMFRPATWLRRLLPLGLRSHSATSRSGSWKGRRRRSAASTRLKMAALAPMPRARVPAATSAKPGARSSWRRA